MTSQEKCAVLVAAQDAQLATKAARKGAHSFFYSKPYAYEQLRAIFLKVNKIDLITPSEFKRASTGKRKDDFRAVLQTQGKNWKDVFATLDTNHDGVVSCDEFILAVSTCPDSTGKDIVDSLNVKMEPTYGYDPGSYYNSYGD